MIHRCAAAALIRGGQVLLGLRAPDRAFYPGVWDVFGGHLESGESAEAALMRELREELDIDIDDPRPLATLPLPGGEGDCRLFLVTRWRGEVRNLQPAEHQRIAWFAPEELPGLPLADPAYLPWLLPLLAPRYDPDASRRSFASAPPTLEEKHHD
ncbi:NUDIX domain-containing protein [Chromobacterium sp. IIBBL 290-4]|uniref:NUDIX domain-containing protein n=1 Tax=Chromobacterium sp. IIBBL 290-4 TaxID=2953890 RepID=UPI0020B6DF1F|nr:NUDIX domain-containing protein [Chromobacterium sp. IIBBL 290-4]UTH75729.1 NUDIX domain-containing protein [Chromobacterium sp. IIBBL 290-4]